MAPWPAGDRFDRRRLLATALAWSALGAGVAGPGLAGSAAAADKPVFRLGVLVFPPYFTDDGDKPDGILVQLWLRLAERLGVETTVSVLPAARLIDSVASDAIDVTLLPHGYPGLPEQKLISSNHPIEWVRMEAYTIGTTRPATRWEDLSGRTVIIEHGYGYGGRIEWLRNPANRVQVGAVVLNAEDGLRALVAGRGEILLHYQSLITVALDVVPVPDLKAVHLSDLEVFINLRADFPDAAQWMARINAAIDADPTIPTHP